VSAHAAPTPARALVHAPAVSVRDLSIGWGDVTLVQDISFEVAPGEIFAAAAPESRRFSATSSGSRGR
jgi:hypothetical protein